MLTEFGGEIEIESSALSQFPWCSGGVIKLIDPLMAGLIQHLSSDSLSESSIFKVLNGMRKHTYQRLNGSHYYIMVFKFEIVVPQHFQVVHWHHHGNTTR